ncbi:hypothetical protein E2542_SST17437 [Spatholobus suberectus]|nr:hypothetical protein E2542_SST17437 [Spatholobus suberectus]
MPKRSRAKKTLKTTESVVMSKDLEIKTLITGRTSFLGSDNLHVEDVVLEEPSETQALATMRESLHSSGSQKRVECLLNLQVAHCGSRIN